MKTLNLKRVIVGVALAASMGFSALTTAELPTDELGKTVNGKAVSAEQFDGKVRVLFFWASSCTECMEAFPALSGIQGLVGSNHLQVIGINQQDTKKRFGDIVNALNNTPLILTRDRNGHVTRKYAVDELPHFVIVGADGKITAEHKGYQKDKLAQLVKKIDVAIIASHENAAPQKKLTSNP